jgi:Methyltransferase FkbM domain
VSLGQPTEFASAVARSLSKEPFVLLDIGCSGGINPMWRIFGDRLLALGVDPNLEEVERLKAREKSNRIEYIGAFIGKSGEDPSLLTSVPRSRSLLADRFSYIRTQEIRAKQIEALSSEEKTRLNKWRERPLANLVLSPLDLIDAKKLRYVDFFKIDVDGLDLEILQLMGPDFTRLSILGCVIEVMFSGSDASHENTFHNVDRLMKRAGYELFDLTTRRYSTRFLPGRYRHIPGDTEYGRIWQGDALYLRDLCQTDWFAMADKATPESLIKLAALFSMFSLPDCAAEVLVKFRDRIADTLDVQMGLDLLAAQAQPNSPKVSYAQYMAGFERDGPYFYGLATSPDVATPDSANSEDGYDLANRILHNGAKCILDGCEMRITTPEAQWAYAVAIPRSAETQSDFVKSTVIARIESGALGFGILNRDESAFLSRASLPTGKQTTLFAPNDKAGPLVFYNESFDQTRAVVQVLRGTPPRPSGPSASPNFFSSSPSTPKSPLNGSGPLTTIAAWLRSFRHIVGH